MSARSKTKAAAGGLTLSWLNRDGRPPKSMPLNPVDLRPHAMKWSYLAGNRAKWSDVPEECQNVDEDALELLEQLGLDEQRRSFLAHARLVEIAIPWIDDDHGWEHRILPWEFLFIRGLRGHLSGSHSPLVVRRLERPGTPPPLKAKVRRVLGVLSFPRGQERVRLANERELELVEGSMSATEGAPILQHLHDPTFPQLKETVEREGGCDAIHFLSVETTGPESKYSYLYLPDPGQNRVECRFLDLATLLGGGGKHPRLVSYSFSASGPRLAAYTVGEGAHASIGFQDHVTDEQCESFFASFYRLWPELQWNVLAAFEKALREVAPLLRGTGIILWLDRPLLATVQQKPGAKPVSAKRTALRRVAIEPRDQLEVSVKAYRDINYSVLHNQQIADGREARRTLFESFYLRRLPPFHGALDVDVEVSLYAGDHIGGPWRRRLSLLQATSDISADIHVPLTSVLARSLRESLRTTIETIVRVGGTIVHQDTHPASLLAIEEWRDDGISHVWLPSFVLPRDAIISEIVQRSRRCLCALVDNFSAGFDGYQLGQPERVDRQAQALWSTLSLDWQLGYINPPPTFTAQSQRLRRPSDVITGCSGTCLDLALLFAACLEFVGIRPVIILAPGHAFPGWWRNETAQLSFTEDVAPDACANISHRTGPLAAAAGAIILGAATAFEHRRIPATWTKGKEAHASILEALEDGDLNVIETTGLTRGASFQRGMEEGRLSLRSRLDFECLIDVELARKYGVTPLPMAIV